MPVCVIGELRAFGRLSPGPILIQCEQKWTLLTHKPIKNDVGVLSEHLNVDVKFSS